MSQIYSHGLYLPENAQTTRGNAPFGTEDTATFRITVIGDSFTFAPHMQADDAFPARLQRFLNLNHPDGEVSPRQAMVNNLGSPGFSTFHEVSTVKSALSHNPSLIILQITLNDAQLRPLTKEPPEIRGQFGPYQPTGFLATLTRHWRTLHLILSRIHNTQSVQSYIRYHKRLFEDAPSKDTFTQSLREISAACKQAQVPLAIVLFPLFDFPIDQSYPFASIHTMIETEAHSLGIPILDLRHRFEGIDV